MARPIVKLFLLFLLIVAGVGSNPRPLVAQNPATVVQSAGTIGASAQVISSEMVFDWHGAVADSAGVIVHAQPIQQLGAREMHARRIGIQIVAERVHPQSDPVDDPVKRPAEPSRLRVSLIFTAN